MKKFLQDFRPHRVRWSAKDRWHVFVLGLATIYEGLVQTLSFGFLSTDARAYVLFDLFEDDPPAPEQKPWNPDDITAEY